MLFGMVIGVKGVASVICQYVLGNIFPLFSEIVPIVFFCPGSAELLNFVKSIDKLTPDFIALFSDHVDHLPFKFFMHFLIAGEEMKVVIGVLFLEEGLDDLYKIFDDLVDEQLEWDLGARRHTA
jgi:hypothetical protein